MGNRCKSVVVPLTRSAKKYGYIIWKKKQDREVKDIIGEKDHLDLLIQGREQNHKHIDWKKRRISITYRVTRQLPGSISQIHLILSDRGIVEVSFH